MKRVLQDGRGMALALTLVALVIVGALVASALFSGTAEQRMAENVRFGLQSFGVAEGAAYGALGTWPANRSTYTGRRAYPLDSAVPMQTDGSYSGTVYRLSSTLYLLDVTGRDIRSRADGLRDGISQRLGLLIRIVPLQADIQAALTTLDESVTRGGRNTFLNGTDNPPPAGSNWSDCGPTGASVAGVRSTLDTTVLYRYGSSGYATLSQQASVQLAPGSYRPSPVVVSGVCETNAQPSNWGDGNDHTSPCGAYFPIVWLKGNPPFSATSTWSILGGQGQGVLLVDGDLSVHGPFTFYAR